MEYIYNLLWNSNVSGTFPLAHLRCNQKTFNYICRIFLETLNELVFCRYHSNSLLHYLWVSGGPTSPHTGKQDSPFFAGGLLLCKGALYIYLQANLNFFEVAGLKRGAITECLIKKIENCYNQTE